MYKVVDKISSNCDVSRDGEPGLTLENEYGGQSVIMDDHCFVLMNGSEDREFRTVKHWYSEAAYALSEYIRENIQQDTNNLNPTKEVSKWKNTRYE